MKTYSIKIASVVSLLWIFLNPLSKAALNKDELSAVLGFPASQLIVDVVTNEERDLWSMPSAKERRIKKLSSPSPRHLILAYRITAKDSQTFFPIMIWVADEGTFLTSEVRQMLANISQSPANPITKGGKGPLGVLELEGTNDGGLYLGKIKIPSRSKEMSEPQERIAMISALHLASEKREIQIALMAALDQGGELRQVVGGERYFHYFGPSGDESGIARYDVADIFRRINLVAIAGISPDITHQSPAVWTSQQIQKTAPKNSPTRLPGNSEPPSFTAAFTGSLKWIWILLSTCFAVIAIITLKKRL